MCATRCKPGALTYRRCHVRCSAGTSLLGAGYCLYSSSTLFVLTLGDGVQGFTYDSMVGEFVLSHPDIRIPESGMIYAFNEGNYMVRCPPPSSRPTHRSRIRVRWARGLLNRHAAAAA